MNTKKTFSKAKTYIVKFFKWSFLVLITFIVLYVGLSFLFTYITISSKIPETEKKHTVYLSTNGIHLDIIIPEKHLSNALKRGLNYTNYEKYLAFGWGDRDFYLQTPTWGDLTAKNALKALFWKSKSLMHVTRYRQTQNDWVEVKVSEEQLEKLNGYIQTSFNITKQGDKTHLENQGYTADDDFYEALGSYSCFKTCNSWVNTALKQNNITACFWTPFDFRVLEINQSL